MTEEQFWRSTPKKIQGLFDVYKTINGFEDDNLEAIDNIIF
jgi:hypothetical protein